MATLQWINASSESGLPSYYEAQRVVRAQAARHYRAHQTRERQQKHLDQLIRQARLCQYRVPSLDIDAVERIERSCGAAEPHDTERREKACSRSTLALSKRTDASDRVEEIPRSPSTWGQETPDPFSSPAQVSKMMALCKTCITIGP